MRPVVQPPEPILGKGKSTCNTVPMSSGVLSIAQARRIALVAQMAPGASRPKSLPGPAAIVKLVGKLNLLQIDSVNVLSRSHYLPVFSRLGAYDRAILDDLTFSPRRRRFFEYWAHEASFLPLEFFPLFRWRMDAARQGEGVYKGLAEFARNEPHYIAAILEEIRSRGPLTVRDLPDPGKRLPGWWGWSPGKIALEYLFWTGEVTAATRRNFERLYDLTERVIPPEIFQRPQMRRADAVRELMRLAAQALGIASFADLRDYFRLPLPDARKALAELVEAGVLEEVAVETWRNPAYLTKATPVPRQSPSCASLLSPFDPLVWERSRTERLFGFSYRIEIYTPAGKRRHGYYVLPFLFGDRFAARLCLKADRAASTLIINTAHAEPGIDRTATVEALARELALLTRFLGLAALRVKRKGDLAVPLRKAIGA
jgi:uncharacterized protein